MRCYPGLSRDCVGLIFVGEAAGERQASQNVLVGQSGVLLENFAFRLAGSEKFENELNGEAGATDDRLAAESVGVGHNALGKWHNFSLPESSDFRHPLCAKLVFTSGSYRLTRKPPGRQTTKAPPSVGP